MPQITQSLEIQAPPERVWDILAHADRYHLHDTRTQEQITSAQKEGIGVTLVVRRSVGPFVVTLNGHMTEWTEAARMTSEWVSGFPLYISTRARMILTPRPPGTRLAREYTWRIRIPIIGLFGERWLASGAERDMTHLMQRIQQAAENQSPNRTRQDS